MSTAIARKDELKNSIERLTPDFQQALPQHISVQKFKRIVLTSVFQNQRLMEATPQSIFAACMKAAQDGLLPDGREAALSVFKVKGVPTATYMPMVGGILKKIRNSGELASITAQCVYENDKFRFWIDEDGEHISHEPLMNGERGNMTHVYALAKTKDGFVYIEVMDKAQIDRVRNSSRSPNDGPWAEWYDEMARKSAIRRLSKRLPMSTDLEQVIEANDDLYEFNEKPAAKEQPKGPKKLESLVVDSEPEAQSQVEPAPESVNEDDLPL